MMRASHRIWVAATWASSINCTSSLSNTHPWKQIITTQQSGLSLERGRERRKTQWIMLWNHVLVHALIVIAAQLSKGKWKKINWYHCQYLWSKNAIYFKEQSSETTGPSSMLFKWQQMSTVHQIVRPWICWKCFTPVAKSDAVFWDKWIWLPWLCKNLGGNFSSTVQKDWNFNDAIAKGGVRHWPVMHDSNKTTIVDNWKCICDSGWDHIHNPYRFSCKEQRSIEVSIASIHVHHVAN